VGGSEIRLEMTSSVWCTGVRGVQMNQARVKSCVVHRSKGRANESGTRVVDEGEVVMRL
jgi:hypothetical protein